jgi:hypothetical protein
MVTGSPGFNCLASTFKASSIFFLPKAGKMFLRSVTKSQLPLAFAFVPFAVELRIASA